MTTHPYPPPQRRSLIVLFLTLLLFLIPPLILTPHVIVALTTALIPASLTTTTTITTNTTLPPPLSHIYTPPLIPPPPFSTPHVIRAFYHAPAATLHVFTGGVHMRNSLRNLTAVACVVGDLLYPAFLQQRDVIHCRTPVVKRGISISIVLLQDAEFTRQLRQPVPLQSGFTVRLNEGIDVTRLPAAYAYDISFINATSSQRGDVELYPREKLWLVASSHQSSPLETPSASFPRYRFCLMTQIAPFSYLLEQWVSHHRRMGFDHVYIFDNGAALNLTHVFRNRPDVEVLRWPFEKSQETLVGWFFSVAKVRCEYVSHMDTDEFLFAPLGSVDDYARTRPLTDVMRRVGDEWKRSGVKFPWVLMQNNGYGKRPEGDLPELYTQRHNRQPFHNGKSLCHTDLQLDSGLVHNCGFVDGAKLELYFSAPKDWDDFVPPTQKGMWPVLVHFRERSWEETVVKWTAGRASGKHLSKNGTEKMKLFGDMRGEMYVNYLKVKERFRWTAFRDYCRRVRKEGADWESVAGIVRRRKSDADGEEMECVEINMKTGKETGNACR